MQFVLPNIKLNEKQKNKKNWIFKCFYVWFNPSLICKYIYCKDIWCWSNSKLLYSVEDRWIKVYWTRYKSETLKFNTILLFTMCWWKGHHFVNQLKHGIEFTTSYVDTNRRFKQRNGSICMLITINLICWLDTGTVYKINLVTIIIYFPVQIWTSIQIVLKWKFLLMS